MFRFKHALPVILAAAALVGCQDTKPQGKEKVTEQWNAARAGVQYGLAKQEFETGDLDGATKNLGQSLALNPKSVPTLILAARLDIERGQLEDADKVLTKARDLDAKNPEIDYYAGVVYQRWQQPQKALDFYSHACEKAPDNLPYLLAKSEMLVALDKPKDALALLQDKVNFFESSPAIRDAVGQLLEQQGRHADAAVLFRQAVMLSPDDKGLKERLGLSLYYAGQYSDAADVLSKLTTTDGYDRRADLLAALGECQLQLDHPREARAAYETAAEVSPSNSGIWLGLAKSALKINDRPRADLALRKAMAIDSKNPQVQLMMGYLRLRENRLPEALACFRQASELDARDTVGLCMLGYVQEKLGHSDQAMRYYAQALKLNPNDELASKLMASIDLHD